MHDIMFNGFIDEIAKRFKQQRKLIKRNGHKKKIEEAFIDQLDDDIVEVAKSIFEWYPTFNLDRFYKDCGWEPVIPVHIDTDGVQYVAEPA